MRALSWYQVIVISLIYITVLFLSWTCHAETKQVKRVIAVTVEASVVKPRAACEPKCIVNADFVGDEDMELEPLTIKEEDTNASDLAEE